MSAGRLKKAFTAAIAFTGAYAATPAATQDQAFTNNNFALTDNPVQPADKSILSNVLDFSEPLPIFRLLGSPNELAGNSLSQILNDDVPPSLGITAGGNASNASEFEKYLPDDLKDRSIGGTLGFGNIDYLGDPDELAGNDLGNALGGSSGSGNIIDRIMPKGYLGDPDELAGNKVYGAGEESDLPTGKIRNESTKGYFTVSGNGVKPSASFSETFTDGKSCVARAGALTAAFGRSVEGVCLGEKSNSIDASVVCNNEEEFGLPVPVQLPVCRPSMGR